MKILKPREFYKLINHGPCVILTTGNADIKNAAPIAWVTPLNDEPPMAAVCVAAGHKTAELIKKYRQFTVNVPRAEHLALIKKTGSVSGRAIDKFSEFTVKYARGKKIDTVNLAGMAGFFECRLSFVKNFEGVMLFAANVLHCEADEACFGKYLLPEKAKTLHHLGGGRFFVSSKAK